MTELDLRLEHVRKSYLRPVLTDINLQVTNDSYITIVGKSGSGKSTLLNILGLVEGYDSGSYTFNGTKIHNGVDYARLRLENIGFIFQSYNLLKAFRHSINSSFCKLQSIHQRLLHPILSGTENICFIGCK